MMILKITKKIKKPNNFTRCCPQYFFPLAKKLNQRYIKMIDEQGFGAPLKIQLTKTLPPPALRNVARCIKPEGILDLKGEILDFYKLAPCVIGDRNVDDFAKPSLGFLNAIS
jgi:hypothetical protein